MGDDPYDFEIALPAAPTSADRFTRSQRRSSDSDENISDVSGSLSNMSGISSDNDSERGSDRERKQRTESSFKRATKSAIEPKTAASSSALDRAKNFLSKYSSATTRKSNGSKAPASLRVGLDLDDDDEFSMESSSGDEKEDIGDSDPPQISKQQIIATQANERQEADILQNDNEDGSQNSEHLPPYSSSSVVATSLSVMAVQFDDRSSGESQAGDSIESFHSEGSDERTRTLTMETPRPTLQKTDFQDHHNDSAGDYDESLQSPSQQIETRQTYAFTSVRPQQSIASESEVYDEDAFEEDSTVMTHAPAHNSSTVAIQPTVSAEKNFDYSMDFSDDEDKRHMQLEVEPSELTINDPARERKSPPTSSRGDSNNDNGEQSTFLESDSFREGEHDEHELDHGAAEPVLVASSVVEPRTSAENNSPCVAESERLSDLTVALRHEPTPAAHYSLSSSIDKLKDRLSLDTGISPIPAVTSQRMPFQQNEQIGEEATTVKQQHVEIVRAYQLDEGIRVKMKDASTQFTGNHAAIQTDLVPDGMHNLFVSPTPTPTFSCSFSRENEVPPSEAKYASCHSKQQPPPPPPISPQLGASAYSLDALKLPTVASTSLYKQQLLNLQEQILQKKRETERIVHDRMTFQYSSLRGIERFIADRRVQKLELWEALMRVDPTLDERKAREAARGDDVKH